MLVLGKVWHRVCTTVAWRIRYTSLIIWLCPIPIQSILIPSIKHVGVYDTWDSWIALMRGFKYTSQREWPHSKTKLRNQESYRHCLIVCLCASKCRPNGRCRGRILTANVIFKFSSSTSSVFDSLAGFKPLIVTMEENVVACVVASRNVRCDCHFDVP